MYKIIAIISLVLSLVDHCAPLAPAPDRFPMEEKPLVSCTMKAQEKPAEYKRMATVYSLEYSDNAVIVVDSDGELWEFYGVEDWAVWDRCQLTMQDNGTPGNVYDDIITSAIYTGALSWEEIRGMIK